MTRKKHIARLMRKVCLSASAQCFHLEFLAEDLPAFDFAPGQFISMVASDSSGKRFLRAYSLAAAPAGNRFDMCVVRVEGGFFSNLLCDLQPGETVSFQGPHGRFKLREPLGDTMLVATGTGVAPMRSFLQHLFPGPGTDHSQGRNVWLVYGTRWETEIYYRDYFERLEREYSNFHYVPTLSRAPESWQGSRGYVQEAMARIVASRTVSNGAIHAYICGIRTMVSSSREKLEELGWRSDQIVVERYG